jgi:primosomal replication protein N
MNKPIRGLQFESIPPEINHVVVTGTLSADPLPGRSPAGNPVILLWVEFPVVDPAHPEALWTWASCLAEVPDGRAQQDVKKLQGGTAILVSGQLSDRWVIENGHTSRRGVIVASLVKAGLSPAQLGLSR